jgi:hypothetical protein
VLIIGDLSAEVPDTNAFHWNFEEYSQDSDRDVFFYGYNASDNEDFFNLYSGHERKIYFNNWAPCEFAQERVEGAHDGIAKERFFNEVYSICPYTSEWLNTLKLDREYKSIFYPFHKNLIPQEFEKNYDVIYHGGIHGQEHIDCIRAMLSYNYRFCSMTHHINALTQECLRFATNVNLAFQQKIQLIAQTKISVCYNLVHIAPDHIPAIQSYDEWQNNEAFSEVGKSNLMPQFKTRFHEAAISKTLNLVHRDPWNIVEDYYVPDEEFVYFTDVGDLHKKIGEISRDWDNYTDIVERAYNKAMNYTCDNFIEEIRRG